MRAASPLVVAFVAFALVSSIFALSGFSPAASPTPGVGSLARRGAQTGLDGESAMVFSVAPDTFDAELQQIVESHVAELPGDWSVVVKKLDTGQYASYRGDEVQISASLYKVWVLVELMRQNREGLISLEDTLQITAGAAAFDISIGELRWEIGSYVPAWQLAERMIAVSDNTAAITLAVALGVDNVNATIHSLGLTSSLLDFGGGDNLTTANDMNRIYELIVQGKTVTRRSSAYMLDILLSQRLDNLIPMGLPEDVPMAHKTGTLEMLLHDSGIVYGPSGPYILTIMSSNLDDYPTAYRETPRLGAAIHEYFNSRPFRPARYFPETMQAVGPSFLLYYNTHGGLGTFGLPLSAEREQSGLVYQYFERARLERPVGADGPVNLGLVGAELLQRQDRSFEPVADPGDTGILWFAETRQSIAEPFLSYWRDNGGQELFGLPLSGVVVEAVGGQEALPVQYFERARFELHGETTVALGQVGAELLASQPTGP